MDDVDHFRRQLRACMASHLAPAEPVAITTVQHMPNHHRPITIPWLYIIVFVMLGIAIGVYLSKLSFWKEEDKQQYQ